MADSVAIYRMHDYITLLCSRPLHLLLYFYWKWLCMCKLACKAALRLVFILDSDFKAEKAGAKVIPGM